MHCGRKEAGELPVSVFGFYWVKECQRQLLFIYFFNGVDVE